MLILRPFTGLLVAGHGVQKVSFHLGGKGLAGRAQEFGEAGFRGGVPTAPAAGCGQIGAGLLRAAGLLTPLAAAGAVMTLALRSTGRTDYGCRTTAAVPPGPHRPAYRPDAHRPGRCSVGTRGIRRCGPRSAHPSRGQFLGGTRLPSRPGARCAGRAASAADCGACVGDQL
ncbi:DoxX family protein [Streptomyces sp. NPDC057781]|uniref:DoxX family protein n=1 Tax=unclassified Streptomyces TaxID=2593676 RepID=UPI00367BD6ED